MTNTFILASNPFTNKRIILIVVSDLGYLAPYEMDVSGSGQKRGDLTYYTPEKTLPIKKAVRLLLFPEDERQRTGASPFISVLISIIPVVTISSTGGSIENDPNQIGTNVA